MEKTYKIFAIILILVGLAVGISYVVVDLYVDANSVGRYTEEEYKDYGETRYNEGLYANEDYKTLCEQYVIQLAEVQSKLDASTAELEKVKEENSDQKEKIETLEAKVEALEKEKTDLIASYETEIARLQGLLDSYESIKNGVSEVNFYIKDVATYTIAVTNGKSIENAPVPANTNEYQFGGWSLDRTTIIDVSEVVINEPTSFYAVLIPKYEVTYIVKESTHTEYVAEGATLNLYEAPALSEYTFAGWYDEDGNFVDIETAVATKDVSLTAKYSLIVDQERLKQAVYSKGNEFMKFDLEEVNLVYVSLEENIVFAAIGVEGEENYLLSFDLTNAGEYTDEITTNDLLVERVGLSDVDEGYLLEHLLGSEYGEAIADLENDVKSTYNLESSKTYAFNISFVAYELDGTDGYVVSPILVSIGNDGEKIVCRKTDGFTWVDRASAVGSDAVETAILSPYGYASDTCFYIENENVEETIFEKNEI